MKALVLCGGIPQAALIEELKSRGIFVILADMNPNVMARPYADKFYPVSVLDVEAVRKLAQEEQVDMILTACADQVLLVQAQVSEELGLPCYIDYQTAKNVSSKELMKQIFVENNIPTSKHIIMDMFDEKMVSNLDYPIIVKPVDSYSSRGVRKVFSLKELRTAFKAAADISRTNTAIIEEYAEGEELTVDAYVENGQARVLSISNIDKIPGNNRFVICRTRYPAQITKEVEHKIHDVAGQIAHAFHLNNSPMLIQVITKGDSISVVEFCARTGGGDKFRLIKSVSGFDVIKAIVDLTLGLFPHVDSSRSEKYIVNEFLYAKDGVLDHFEGFAALQASNVIEEYYELKKHGTRCGGTNSSGDRIAYFTVSSNTIENLLCKHGIAAKTIKAIDTNGSDLLRHDLIVLKKDQFITA